MKVFLCFFVAFIEEILSKVIVLPYIKKDNYLLVNLLLGDRGLTVDFKIDLINNRTEINNMYYQISDKGKKQYESDLYSDEMIIPIEEVSGIVYVQVTLKEFFFYYNKVNNNNILSLAYDIKDRNLSLIHQLYKMKISNGDSFGFLKGNSNRGFFYIGGFPTDFVENKNNVTFYVNRNTGYWSIDLNKIIIDQHEYQNSDEVVFQTITENIYIPHKFVLFLKDTVFKPYLQKNECYYTTDDPYLRCQCNIFQTINYIQFIFNKTIVYFRNNFYEELEGQNICILLLKETINNRWEFGISFIEQHSILFDYNDSSITFYGNETKFRPYQERPRDIKIIRTVMSILNFINIFSFTLLLYSKITTHNNI